MCIYYGRRHDYEKDRHLGHYICSVSVYEQRENAVRVKSMAVHAFETRPTLQYYLFLGGLQHIRLTSLFL